MQEHSIQLIGDCCLEKILKSNRTCLRHGTRPDHCIHPGHQFAYLDSVNSSIGHSMVHLNVALDAMAAGAGDAIAVAHLVVGDDDAVAAASYYDYLVDRNDPCGLCLDHDTNHVHGYTIESNTKQIYYSTIHSFVALK